MATHKPRPRFYLNDKANNGTDTVVMRRVRPFGGHGVSGLFDFRVMPDFGMGPPPRVFFKTHGLNGTMAVAETSCRQVQGAVGLDWLPRDPWTSFSDGGLPTDLVPQRDVGFQVSGDLFGRGCDLLCGCLQWSVDGTVVIWTA